MIVGISSVCSYDSGFNASWGWLQRLKWLRLKLRLGEYCGDNINDRAMRVPNGNGAIIADSQIPLSQICENENGVGMPEHHTGILDVARGDCTICGCAVDEMCIQSCKCRPDQGIGQIQHLDIQPTIPQSDQAETERWDRDAMVLQLHNQQALASVEFETQSDSRAHLHSMSSAGQPRREMQQGNTALSHVHSKHSPHDCGPGRVSVHIYSRRHDNGPQVLLPLALSAVLLDNPDQPVTPSVLSAARLNRPLKGPLARARLASELSGGIPS